MQNRKKRIQNKLKLARRKGASDEMCNLAIYWYLLSPLRFAPSGLISHQRLIHGDQTKVACPTHTATRTHKHTNTPHRPLYGRVKNPNKREDDAHACTHSPHRNHPPARLLLLPLPTLLYRPGLYFAIFQPNPLIPVMKAQSSKFFLSLCDL